MTQPLLKVMSPIDINDTEVGVGRLLKSLRQAKQLSLNDVSARLKFSTRQLTALEDEQWDILPTGVSLRGFVKNYGRFLETDVDALVIMLDKQVGATGVSAIALPGGSLEPADLPMHNEGAQRPWGWLIVIVLLLVVAGFYAIDRGWVPESWLNMEWLNSFKK